MAPNRASIAASSSVKAIISCLTEIFEFLNWVKQISEKNTKSIITIYWVIFIAHWSQDYVYVISNMLN